MKNILTRMMALALLLPLMTGKVMAAGGIARELPIEIDLGFGLFYFNHNTVWMSL